MKLHLNWQQRQKFGLARVSVKIGEYEAGIASFRRVIERFSSERILVEEAYLRLADMREDMGDIDGAILTYREAIDVSSDRSFTRLNSICSG